MKIYFAEGMYLGASVVIALMVIFSIIALLWALAYTNIIFTFVQEGQVKAVKAFGGFRKALMSFTGREFRRACEEYNLVPGEDFDEIKWLEEKDHDPWDILRLTKKGRKKLSQQRSTPPALLKKRVGGLRLIGIPLLHSVPKPRFSWVSLEQKTEEGSSKVVNVPVFKEEHLDYGLAQEDVYVSETGKVETNDLLPVDVMLLITCAIINPRKAFFNVQHWLEATQNQIRPVIREYIGIKKFADLITKVKGGERELIEVLTEGSFSTGKNRTQRIAGGTLNRIAGEYGVEVRKVQIFGIDPTEAFRQLTTKKYEGQMEAQRIKEFYKAVQEFKDVGLALNAFETLQKTGSNVTLLSGKGDVVPTMQLANLDQNGIHNDHLFLDASGSPIPRTEHRR